ncbi:hypothetical protein BDR07DRAFT_1499209 [Suillus spraguei]|nr:hypothetical protein BDR07DRAFT_1499209 [Suillus spraguei]
MLSDSDSSLASCRSRVSADSGAVESQQNSQAKGRGKGKGKGSNCKEAAVWTVEEEAAFLNFLYENKTGTDGVAFSKKVYLAAAVTNWDGVTSNSEETQPVCWEVLLCSKENEDKEYMESSKYEFKSKSNDSKMVKNND